MIYKNYSRHIQRGQLMRAVLVLKIRSIRDGIISIVGQRTRGVEFKSIDKSCLSVKQF